MTAAAAAAAKTPLAGALAEGLDTLSLNQTVTFTKYLKVVLPMDGFVFWVRSGLLSPAAILNASAYNTALYNGAGAVSATETVSIKGSMHFATDQVQAEDETFGRNRMIFTALSEIDEFNEISPQVMWLGEFEGLRFSFANRGAFYKQADLYHYMGEAVYPAMESQIIDDAAQLNTRQVVVSNSLPIWLGLTMAGELPVYPSFLVDPNIRPPWVSIHIPPDQTIGYAAAPILNSTLSRSSLASDRVRVTIYGLRNGQALDWLDYVLDFMANGDVLGLQDFMPTVRDDKRTQDELTVLAMKKTIEFKVSYLQSTVRDIARQLILSCTPTVIIGDQP